MRGSNRTSLTAVSLIAASVLGGCGQRWVDVPEVEGAVKSTAVARSERPAYDGAPPVIPHDDFGAACSSCHNRWGISVEGVGYAPANPHADTREVGETTRCRQCHVFVTASDVFVASSFQGLQQDLRSGGRLNPISPPTIPHRTLMRSNCVACHAGPGSREEIKTSHPERTRCRQCHVPEATRTTFNSALGTDLVVRDSTR